MIRLFDVEQLEDPPWKAVNEEIQEIVAGAVATQYGHYVFDYPFIAEALAGLPRGSDVLDVGCLSGAIQVYMARRHHVTGTDRAVKIASELNGRLNTAHGVKIEFIPPDALGNREFDAIYGASSLEHNPYAKQREMVAQYARRLKPGGLFAATVVASMYPPGKPATYEWVKAGRNVVDFVAFSQDDLVATYTGDTGLRLLDGSSNWRRHLELWAKYRARFSYPYMPIGICLVKD